MANESGGRVSSRLAKEPVLVVRPGQGGYPPELGESGPLLYARGNLALLSERRIGVFSSVRAPGTAILKTMQWAASMREGGIAVISGFHAPLEQECLSILMRSGVPVIVCAAREITYYRFLHVWAEGIHNGKLLLISSIARSRRVTRESSQQRNELIAALAHEVVVLHAEPGSNTERLVRHASLRGKTVRQL